MLTAEPITMLERFRAGDPGVYRDIPSEDYFALPAFHASLAKVMHCEGPATVKAIIDGRIKAESTALDIGSGVHALVLQEPEFRRQFVVAEQCSATVQKTGKRCENSGIKLVQDKWLCGVHGKGFANDEGRTVLPLDSWRRVCGARDAIWKTPAGADARKLLACATDFELTILYVDEQTGLLVKCRLDLVAPKIGVIIDLKTCRSVKTFNEDSYRAGYRSEEHTSELQSQR